MVALRATMHVALHIADDKAFAKLVPADKKNGFNSTRSLINN